MRQYLLYINDKAKGGTLVFKTKEQTITFGVAMANTSAHLSMTVILLRLK